jgi:KDO2-lipid IV(A) lauroyltransferase
MLSFIFIQLSRLPIKTLYVISTILSFTLNHIVKYRKAAVYRNLNKSFPELNEREIKQIANGFYNYLADISIETIKLYRLSEKELENRVVFENPEILKKYQSNNRGVFIMMGHSGNWEWAGAITSIKFTFKTLPVYRKLKDDSMNQFFTFLRSRHGGRPTRDKDISNTLLSENKNLAVAMLADQTPGGRKGWWLSFLNQDTPFFRGSEILATRYKNMDVVFAHVNRKRRGYYSISLEMAPSQWRSEPFLLTKSFAKFLETNIKKDPSNWLWSHKRWKHTPNSKSHFID